MEDSFEPFEGWVNINSFVSRFFQYGLDQWYRFAVWTMRDSLEGTRTRSRDLMRCRLAAAAQWIQHNPDALFVAMQTIEPDDGDCGMLKSQFFREEKVLSVERWVFWMHGFQELAELEVSQELKTIASRAAERMEQVQRIHT